MSRECYNGRCSLFLLSWLIMQRTLSSMSKTIKITVYNKITGRFGSAFSHETQYYCHSPSEKDRQQQNIQVSIMHPQLFAIIHERCDSGLCV